MRLGLFGGTFDPPHVGHLLAASDALEALQLDRVIFVPNAAQPLKAETPRAAAAHRLAMVRLLCQDDARFDVDPLEVERGGLSFTIDTVRTYRARHPGAALFLLVGGDVVRTLPSWREPEEIRRLAEVVIVTRGDAGADGWDSGPATEGLRRIRTRRVEVSATEIRARLRDGKSVRGFLTDAVREYVSAHSLYVGGRDDEQTRRREDE